jgi:hypothetical protein
VTSIVPPRLPKTYTIHVPDAKGLAYHLGSELFDSIVDGGYDIILLVTPTRRYITTVEDWQDYGYYDVDDGEDIIVLNKSYMSR